MNDNRRGSWNCRPGQGKGLRFLREHVAYDGDDCLIWPLGRNANGHGQVSIKGRVRRAHRVMCCMAHGEPPTPSHEAAHSCGRGHDACVNPRHLSWKTREENQADRYAHQRLPPRRVRVKLTREQVAEIRVLAAAGATNTELAARFNVSRPNIRQVVKGQTWAPGSRDIEQLPAEQVREIRALRGKMKPRFIAKRFGITTPLIHRIQAGRSHRYVE
jgi:hypothetical protein